MSMFTSLSTPKLPLVTTEIVPPETITMKGTITTREPGADLTRFFRAVHEAAKSEQLRRLRMDVSGLSFVNSSAVRLFVDWASWVKNETGKCYTLCFVTNRKVTWQKTSFTALRSLMGSAITVEEVD